MMPWTWVGQPTGGVRWPRTTAMAVAVALFTGAGCGEDVLLRPLVVDVRGISALAERLVVGFIPGDSAPQCTQVTLETVADLNAPVRLVWERSADDNRMLETGGFDSENVTVIAHTEDDVGGVIQVGCLEVEYSDIESPEVLLILSPVML